MQKHASSFTKIGHGSELAVRSEQQVNQIHQIYCTNRKEKHLQTLKTNKDKQHIKAKIMLGLKRKNMSLVHRYQMLDYLNLKC